MSLTSLPNALTTYVNHSTPIIKDISLSSNSGLSTTKLTEERIFSRTTGFISKISQTFFKQANAFEVRDLNELLRFVSKNGMDSIPQDALVKNNGYFTRFFSNESWQDWCENKTPLGKVVSLYCERVTHSTRLEALMDRLDKKVLEVANQDAALLLKSLQIPKKSTDTQEEVVSITPSQGIWSSFLSLPVAEGYVFNTHHFNARNFPPNFDVSTLNGTNGFVLNGVTTSDESGKSVSGAGDINGDGIADLVVGAPGQGSTAGKTYVIFGSKAGWSSSISLSSLNGVNGFVLNGNNTAEYSGTSVSGAGDINGDGIADLVVGAPGGSFGPFIAGKAYVIFGSKAGWSSPISASTLNGANGFVINGENINDGCGGSVSGGGDINGDGIADLVVGAGGADSSAGKTYIIFGSKAGWSSPISLSSLNGANGFVLNGNNTSPGSGASVSGAGDINGDGIADLVVGAPGGGSGVGKAYVIFGSKGGWSSSISLSSLNGANGFVLNDADVGDISGFSVSGAGDINGDGIADLVVGAPLATLAAPAGKTYVIFGSKAGWSSSISLSSLNGANGFLLNGENADDESGYSVSGAGDINGDGIADLVVGAPQAGKTYAIFGSKAGWSSPISLSSLNGANGFAVIGNVNDLIGYSVSGAGDINGDGSADVVVGAPFANSHTGKTYVIFGQGNGMTTTTPSATTTRVITTTPPVTTTRPADAGNIVPDWKTTAVAVVISVLAVRELNGE